jgi:integrase
MVEHAEIETPARSKPGPKRAKPATAVEVAAKAKRPGRHSFGDGLLMTVTEKGSASWSARFLDPHGRRRDVGLGKYPEVSLAEARDRVATFRRQVRDGLDPIEERRKAKEIVPTFADLAKQVHKERAGGYRNPKHAAQWITSLDYVSKSLGPQPIDKITGPMIVRALKPIWTDKPETARRVLQRIGVVVAWAAAHGYRESEAPMKAIRMGLPPQTDKPKHHVALPYADAPAALQRLRAKPESVARACLEFTILTAARSGEARGATWDEIDLEAKTWTVPADRIKMGREHIVPLSGPALALVKRLHETRHSPLIFPGLAGKRRKPGKLLMLSDVAISKALAEIAPGVTVHGWRSTFRDWCAEETAFPGEVAEMALAHAIGNRVEAAYRRGALLEKRRQLMEAWAAYLEERPANVVPIGAAAVA